VQHTPARLARHLTPSLPLAGSTRAALEARGIQQLFVHQAAAVDALCCQRKHVVVATSTASGKSLCYNVPMLEALARDRDVSNQCTDRSACKPLPVGWCMSNAVFTVLAAAAAAAACGIWPDTLVTYSSTQPVPCRN
jgi:hypothetical protein